MKLLEAGTVLLTVGGVLLGPIVRQYPEPQGTAYVKCEAERKRLTWIYLREGMFPTKEQLENGQPPPATPPTLQCERPAVEPAAETCERAMREIGAKEGADPNYYLGGDQSPGPEDGTGWLPNGKWFVDGQRVLCIPAPSGLAR